MTTKAIVMQIIELQDSGISVLVTDEGWNEIIKLMQEGDSDTEEVAAV